MKDSRLKNDELRADDLLIDELVSGHLTGERYRAALRALDAEPAKWRACALAFLEDQALRSDLCVLAKGTIDWSSSSSSESATPVEAVPHAQVASNVNSLRSKTSLDSRARGALSTAALLLISFTVGWLGSEVWVERQQSPAVSGADSRASASVDPIGNAKPAVGKKLEPQFVVDRPGSFDYGIPSPIRELERNGRISVKTIDMLVPTTLDDGSSVLVPVQHMTLGRTVESY